MDRGITNNKVNHLVVVSSYKNLANITHFQILRKSEFRDIGDVRAGWAAFGRSVNPISIKGGQIVPPTSLSSCPPSFRYLPASLNDKSAEL